MNSKNIIDITGIVGPVKISTWYSRKYRCFMTKASAQTDAGKKEIFFFSADAMPVEITTTEPEAGDDVIDATSAMSWMEDAQAEIAGSRT